MDIFCEPVPVRIPDLVYFGYQQRTIYVKVTAALTSVAAVKEKTS